MTDRSAHMTKEADKATLQQVIDDTFSALGVTNNEAALIEIERLQAASRPAPDAGLVEREALADLASHRSAWRNALMKHVVSSCGDDESYWQHEFDAFERVASALLSSRAVVGEPVATDDMVDVERVIAKHRAIPTKEAQFIALCVRQWTLATPAPSGRDPATIELSDIARMFDGMNDGLTADSCKYLAGRLRALAAPAAIVTEER